MGRNGRQLEPQWFPVCIQDQIQIQVSTWVGSPPSAE
jgi:hypothetical protein